MGHFPFCLKCLLLHALSSQLALILSHGQSSLFRATFSVPLPSPPKQETQGQAVSGGESSEGGSPHLPASKWLCNESGGLWAPEVAGRGIKGLGIQRPPYHHTLPLHQGGGAQWALSGERRSLPAGGGHTLRGHCPRGPEVLLTSYPSTLLQYELSSGQCDLSPPRGFIFLPPLHYRGNCAQGQEGGGQVRVLSA